MNPNIFNYILLIVFVIIQSCHKDPEQNTINCVPNHDLDKFNFYGRHQLKFDFYTKDIILDSITMEADVEDIPIKGNATITFNQDFTFELNLFLDCDSVESAAPICSSDDYDMGELNIQLSGNWDFEQYYDIEYRASGHGELLSYKYINGNCILTITESNEDIFICDIINANMFVTCTSFFTATGTYMGFDIQFGDYERISMYFE